MNANVCVVTIIFLSVESVAGLICLPSAFKKRNDQQQPSTEKPEDKCDSKGTQNFTCNSQKSCHEWYQAYQNGSLQIATVNIPMRKWGKRIRFTIKVEEFDNNTEIYCENSNEKTERPVKNTKIVNATINSNLDFDSNNEPWSLIKIGGNETWENIKDLPTITSNENQNVSFNCLEPSNTTYIQLGIINTTTNMITTFNSTHNFLNITHNGTILCCVYYEVNETAEEMWITRVVANKTLLHYNYSGTFRRDSLEGREIIHNTDSPADQGHQTIIITIAVALVLILLVSIVTCKKCFRKKPQSEAKVLYADLDMLRQMQPDSLPRPGPAEESPYAQIIGEMKPQTK